MAAGLCMAGTAVTLLVTYQSQNDETKTSLYNAPQNVQISQTMLDEMSNAIIIFR